MSVSEITQTETRARAELVETQGYEIELDISQGISVFHSTTTLRFSCTSPGVSTYVDLLAVSADHIHSIMLNGVDLAPAEHYADGRITLPALAAQNTLRIAAALEYSTPGFHRSTDPVDGKTYTYTKFEPDHARRVFACFEQPDLKAPFTISVIAPADWTVISTQPTPEPVAGPRPGLARWDFAPTPRLSTYLMHVTAGEYHVVPSSHTTPRGQTLPMLLASRASLAESLAVEAEELFATTRAGLDHFTALFDMDFPFAKYDQQFVPHYPAGATEHPAAVTIDDGQLFRSGATAAEYEWRAEAILHEMAHMWFGDLVTMRWWDDLWLNESFAEWAGFQASAAVTRFTEAWTSFAADRKSWGYATDLSPGTHPIAASVATVSEAMANFDGISYAKGASVLRQLIAFLGEPAFVAGLRTYFAEHAWGNTTLEDFLRHLSTAAGKDLRAWSAAWLRTEGQLDLVEALLGGEETTIAGLEVGRKLRWALLSRLAQHGRAGDAEIDAESVRDPSDQGERAALAARAGIPDAAHKEAAWAYLTGDAGLPMQTVVEVGEAFRQTTDPALLAPYRDRYFAELPVAWERRKSFAKQATARVLLPTSVIDGELFALLDSFLDQHKDADAALVRSVLEGRDTAARAASSRELRASA